MTERFAHNMASYPNGPCDYPSFAVACQRRWSRSAVPPELRATRTKADRDWINCLPCCAFYESLTIHPERGRHFLKRRLMFFNAVSRGV